MKFLPIFVLLILSLIAIGFNAVYAQVTSEDSSAIQCSIDDYCDIRLSYSGQIYIFKNSNKMLYISDDNNAEYLAYDLSVYARQLIGIYDVVLFDEIGMVVFDSEDINGRGLRLYNLTTGEFQTLDLYRMGYEGRIIQCNQWNNLAYLPQNFIMRLGSQNQLMFCAVNSDGNFIANILDITTQSIVQTINLDYKTHGSVLIAGLDGNLYFEAGGLLPPVLETTLADAGGATYGISLIFKFSPQTNTWSVNQLPLEQRFSDSQFYTPPVTMTLINELVAVDTLGRYYFYQAWDDAENISHTEVRGLSPNFDQMANITDSDFGGDAVISGISGEGQLLLRLDKTLEGIRIVNVDNYFSSTATLTNESLINGLR